ncbi:STAS domain-containing protein [Botrimarina sp.]|uniref:STAS domain-containing protein n=1 Tax=Botrimarina sp. TaxID=2795802 RepID=UPI0032EBBC11
MKRTRQGAVDVVGVDAPLTAESGGELLAAYDDAREPGRPQWVLDLAETPLIDSAGCEALLDLRDRALGAGGVVCLAGVSPLCHDVLLATGLDAQFPVFQSTKSAVAYFAK